MTGANGFIGKALVKELASRNIKVYAVVRQGRTHSDELQNIPGVILTYCSMDAYGQLAEEIQESDLDAFYHLAWAGSAGAARTDIRRQLQNVQWSIDALQAAGKLGCKRFIGAGSIMEHEAIAAALTQGNRPGMGYIYGASKLVAHMMCMSVAADIGIDLIWPEITNAYGAGERSPRMINTTIQKCIRGESPRFTSGTQNYDFVYIDDVVRAFRLIGDRGKPFRRYLIGSSTARPLKEFLLEMQTAVAPELEFCFGDVPFTGVDLPLSQFDCTQTETDTGFRAEVSFAEGCLRTMNWWKEMGTG